MFGSQQAAPFFGALPSGASGGQPVRGSVFGGSQPSAATAGTPSARSVFGGQAPGSIGGSGSQPRSVFGGRGSNVHAGQPSPASTVGGLTPAAVFGNRTSAPSVFGARPVSQPVPAAATALPSQPSGLGGLVGGAQQQRAHAGTPVPGAAADIFSRAAAAATPARAPQTATPASVFGARSAAAAAAHSAATAADVFGAQASRQPPAVPAVFGSTANAGSLVQPPAAAGRGSSLGASFAPGASGFASLPAFGSSSHQPVNHSAEGGETMTAGGRGVTFGLPQTMSAASPGLFGKALPADTVTAPASAAAAGTSALSRQQPPAAGLFGKAPSAAAPAAAITTSALQQSGLLRPLYSELAALTEEELAQFKASRFTRDRVPLRPPPRQLVH